MKVLFLNTFDNYGGAALACRRVFDAVRQDTTLQARMLVREATLNRAEIGGVAKSYWQKKTAFARFAAERLYFRQFEKDKSVRFAFSPANIGMNIARHPWVQEADILHLHWINFGFLSLKGLERLFNLGKPIVWTLHDMWTFTGGCHYTGTCTHFQASCGNCFFLKKPHNQDISAKILAKKVKTFRNIRLRLVTSSHWLGEEARKSSLIQENGLEVQTIPTPIQTEKYYPHPPDEVRRTLGLPQDKFLLLFGAMNVADKRKGFAYLKEALQILHSRHPQLKQSVELVIFGKGSKADFADLPYVTHYLSVLKGDTALAQAYSACHTFVLPSLEDNLPNTVQESLACGTPTIAFRTGGIPDMIDHQHNGWLAKYLSSEDLAQGILHFWELYQNNPPNYSTIRQNAREKVLHTFSEERVKDLYKVLYQRIL
jgi:glycosyltransferase involved in cell wall biosynthesis